MNKPFAIVSAIIGLFLCRVFVLLGYWELEVMFFTAVGYVIINVCYNDDIHKE